MKLSRIYTNKPEIFYPIDFIDGFNVVMGEIRKPEHLNADTHNLGKSVLGSLINFCMLGGVNKNFFLKKFSDRFDAFVFFLEIALDDGQFLTIKRGVQEATKISFKFHELPQQDFSTLTDVDWDNASVAFDEAKTLLDGWLNWQSIKPASYRQVIGYFLRSQHDYGDVFQLIKFRGKDQQWKPSLATLMGFNGSLITKQYEKELKLKEESAKVTAIELDLGDFKSDSSKIEGLLILKQIDIIKMQNELDTFKFYNEDFKQTENIVNGLDVEIADLNSRSYSLKYKIKKIADSLKSDKILFKPDEAEALFKEVQIVFEGQIKKDFEQLIAFNNAITEERNSYLKEDLAELRAELKEVNLQLQKLDKERQQAISFIQDENVFDKYKKMTNQMVKLRAEVEVLEHKRDRLRDLQEQHTKIETIKRQCNELAIKVRQNVEAQNSNTDSLFNRFRTYFSEIIEAVINQKAMVTVNINGKNHLDFKESLLDVAGKETGADDGHSYKKLMCIAFDLALLRVHLDVGFPRFVYHDGAFETLDDRKKVNLLKVFREYAALGLQPIVTMIDSDIPKMAESEFDIENDVILTLHDEGDDGLLFKMPSW